MFKFNTTVDGEVKWFVAITPYVLLPFIFDTAEAADTAGGKLMG
jgi:hypothetical protein